MSCYKTGAVILVSPYDEYARCDVHEVGNVYYFRINNLSRTRNQEEYHTEPLFMIIDDFEGWWDKEQLRNTSTLIALKEKCNQLARI